MNHSQTGIITLKPQEQLYFHPEVSSSQRYLHTSKPIKPEPSVHLASAVAAAHISLGLSFCTKSKSKELEEAT